MPDADPLEPSDIQVRAVQFVGTNVEMTYLVDAPADEAEARLDALLESRLGLYAQTPTGEVDADDGHALQRFSVIASPLDRLFHKIGPIEPLTVIKHASLTLDLSEINLARQSEGLVRQHPAGGDDGDPETWPTWDVGKLLGTLLRRPEMLGDGDVRIASVDVRPRTFPDELLRVLPAHVAAHDGVRLEIAESVRAALGAPS